MFPERQRFRHWEDRVTPAVERLKPGEVITPNLVEQSGRFRELGPNVLDVGYANWTNSLFMAQHGQNVTGVDLEEEGVSRYKKHAETLGVDGRITHIRADAREAVQRQLKGKRFTGVLSHNMLHVFEPAERAKIIRRLQALTVPGGTHIITGLSTNDPYANERGRRNGLAVEEMRKLYTKRGWSIDTVRERFIERTHTHRGGVKHTGHARVLLIAKKLPRK